MFQYLNNLSDRVKLLTPFVLCTAALAAVGWFAWVTIDRVKVGGPIDADIISGKDLMADVLPPPMYLVETHLIVQETAGVGNPKRVDAFEAKFAALRKEYDDRQAYWVKTLSAGQARDLVTGPLDRSAREYFDICERQLVPALKAGDERKARELANGVLKEKYAAQRTVVDQVVKLTTDENESKVKEAANTVRSNTWLMLAMMAGVPLVAGIMSVVIVRKVTGKTQAALERARDAESQVAAIGRSQAVIEFNMDGTVRTANDIFLAVLGYSLDEVQGKHHRTFCDPSFADSAEYRELWAKLARGEPWAGDTRRLTKSGKEVWLQAAYNPICDASGKPYKVVNFAGDVTKRVRTAKLAEYLSLVANNTDTSVIITDANGLTEYVNPGFTKLTGHTLADIRGKKPGEALQGTLTDQATRRRIREKLARREPVVEEILNYTKAGQSYWIMLAINPVVDDKGNLTKFVAVQTNINDTKTKQLEVAAQIAAIARSQAVIEFEADGKVITANDNFLNAIGYSLSEIQGRHHSLFCDPAYVATHDYREFWAKLNRGEAWISDFRRIGKGGKEVWIRASYNPIQDVTGKVVKVVKFATDITAAKLLEMQTEKANDQLRRNAETILAAVNAVAVGDFTVSVPDLGTDAVGQMATALNKAITSVRTALEGVREVSEQLADASGQLASASEEIASGAQEQASSLEETASTLEEITATVKQNSDSAQQARQLASGSRDVAEKGGQVVGTAVEAMADINQSSKKIADIITTIDEIAFQTNLLALNAAVEAARAGEQGRGFAVVASEVRNLAQRSATAAKEIKGLINDSVKKVEAGTDLVNKSGTTLGEIVTSVKRVTDIVTEIAAASREQSTGIDQVNKAVTQMDAVTQRNASQTEEMSATAQTLTEQAGQLRDLVARFKLSDAGRPTVAPHRPAAKPGPKPRPAVAKAMRNRHAVGHANGRHELDDLSGGDDGFTEF